MSIHRRWLIVWVDIFCNKSHLHEAMAHPYPVHPPGIGMGAPVPGKHAPVTYVLD